MTRDAFNMMFAHCSVLTRVALASTCRQMRKWFHTSPLIEEWAVMNGVRRWFRAIECNEPDMWHFYPTLETGELREHCLRLCVQHDRLDVLKRLVEQCNYHGNVGMFLFQEAGRCKRREICSYMLSSDLCTRKSDVWPGIFYSGDVLLGAVSSGDWKWVEEVLVHYCQHMKMFTVEHLISKGLTKGGHDQCIIAQGVFVRGALNFPYETVPYGALDEIEAHLRACALEYTAAHAPIIFTSKRPDVMDLYLRVAKSSSAFTNFIERQIKWCVVLYDFDIFLKLYEAGGMSFFAQWLEEAYLAGRLDIVRYIVESLPLKRTTDWFPMNAYCPSARLRQYVADNFSSTRLKKKLRLEN